MRTRNRKRWGIVIFVGWFCVGDAAGVRAANISDFLKITPYVEVEGSYNDNLFEIPKEASLPQDAKERTDLTLSARVGASVDLTFDRPYLTLGLGLNYVFEYLKYVNNTHLDDTRNNLDVKVTLASNYEEGIIRDRLKVNLKDGLTLIPVDENEPLFRGNRTFRNSFEIGADYKIISTRRMAFLVGYGYGRVDFVDSPINVASVVGYANTSELTQASQTHRGKADFEYTFNPQITATATYTYDYALRPEQSEKQTSADFSRQNLLGGFQVKLSPRIQGNVQAGYGLTKYNDVGERSQADQNDFIMESSINANFAHQPLVTIGYRQYFTENDFGDTLLTGDVFGRLGIKFAPGFFVNFAGDYIREYRDLLADETTQRIFGVNTEYELAKGMKLLAGYDYTKREFFAHNFLNDVVREETSHIVSGGVEYKIGRRFLLKGLYSYTDKIADIAVQEFNRNKFTASGKVIF